MQVVKTYSRYIDIFKPLLVEFKQSFQEIRTNFIKPDAHDIYERYLTQTIQRISDFFESNKLTSTAQKMASISLVQIIDEHNDVESFVRLLIESKVPVAHESINNYNEFIIRLKTSIEAIQIETEKDVKNKTKHPFHDYVTFELFLYLHEWMKPHDKVKYSYIFEHLRHYLGNPINEKEYFTYVNELTGLGMTLRHQYSATSKKKVEQVKDLSRKFRESKG